MLFNPIVAEIAGRDHHKALLQEAEQRRLVRIATLANPSGARKIWLIFRDRWGAIGKRRTRRKIYRSFSHISKNSTNL